MATLAYNISDFYIAQRIKKKNESLLFLI